MSMNNNSMDEFLKALRSLKVAKVDPIEYRLYYDEAGGILSCSMQNHPDGNYIIVTKDEYYRYFDYYVDVATKNLIKVDRTIKYVVSLKKSNQGFATVAKHPSIILEDGEQVPDTEYYEPNN